MTFSGVLVNDSPGFFSWIETEFPREVITSVCNAYSLAFAHGGSSEGFVKRPEGASFNPRPARICQILMKEERIRDPFVIRVALLSTSKSPNFSAPYHLSDEAKSASMVVEALNAKEIFLIRQDLNLVLLAIKLDELRHLHMTTLDTSQMAEFIKDITDRILPSSNQLKGSRLFFMLQEFISRFNRT